MTEEDGRIHSLSALRRNLSRERDVSARARAIASYVAQVFRADRVELQVEYKPTPITVVLSESSEDSTLWSSLDPNLEGPLFVADINKVRLEASFKSALNQAKAKSFAKVPVFADGLIVGFLAVYTIENYKRWQPFECLLLEALADLSSALLQSPQSKPKEKEQEDVEINEQLVEITQRSKRLLEYGNLILVRTDSELAITDVLGDTENVLGYKPEELLGMVNAWSRIVHPEDLRKLDRKVKDMGDVPSELNEEIRLVSKQGEGERWLILRAVPNFDDGKFIGWEGFGVDISEKKLNEQEIEEQKSRIQALYEVARSLVINLDPAVVTLKGLKALIKATNSDGGVGCFYDEKTGKLELVATEGLSQYYIDNAVPIIEGGQSLVRYSVENKQGLLLDNIQNDPRAATKLAKAEGVESTIVIPLIFESQVLGAIVTFRKEKHKYTEEDFDLVAAACSQIALALKQAETYQEEREDAESTGMLYRLSHELAKVMAPEDIASHAFPIIQEELSCKRMWLGVINEQGTHLVGKGGFGPGIRRGVIDLQVELDLRHDFLDEALQAKRPVIVEPGQKMECSGLTRLIKRLELGTMVIVPLISLGQVVGVFIVEPSLGSRTFIERKLGLLANMASEMASVILARRFESKMAEADKMRMAGLLASGVAHNFNNMLQAVMGQASLIEMQLPQESPLAESARTIINSASKGASLIKQLLSFSAETTSERELIKIDKMLSDSQDFYRSIVGSDILLQFNVSDDIPPISADYSGVQHVLTNLVVNAKEAVHSGAGSYVKISAAVVRLRSGEVDPELSPGQYVRIDVEDDGIGLDDEQLRRCFEPFFTTKNVDTSTGIGFEGSGLGLSSAYSIARQHDGIIKVRSVQEEGTVFSVYLPSANVITKEVSEGMAGEAVGSIVFNLGEESIHTVKHTLASLGMKVYTIKKREDVLRRIDENLDNIQMLVMDIDRAGSDPMTFIQSLTRQYPELKILAASVDDKRWTALFKSFKNVEVVDKPIGVWAVHSAIKELSSSVDSLNTQVEQLEYSSENGSKPEEAKKGKLINPQEQKHGQKA